MLSLLGDEGRMFSMRTPFVELTSLLGHCVNRPILVITAGNDEYVANGLDARINVRTLLAALSNLAPASVTEMAESDSIWAYSAPTCPTAHQAYTVYGADHSFHGQEALLARIVTGWVCKMLSCV